MNKFVFLFLICLLIILLTGVNTEKEVEVEFLEYGETSKGGNYVVFVSHDLETYLKLDLTKYELTHKLEEFKKIETIKLYQRKFIFSDPVITRYETKDERRLYEMKY